MRLRDLAGQRFGRLSVIERAPNVGGRTAWLCACECGTRKVIGGRHMLSGKVVSCGCYNAEISGRHAPDLTGQRFGRLVVVGQRGVNRHGAAMWECACDCGGATTTQARILRGGMAKSCGCLRKQLYLDGERAECSSCGKVKPWAKMVMSHGVPASRCKACHRRHQSERLKDPEAMARYRAYRRSERGRAVMRNSGRRRRARLARAAGDASVEAVAARVAMYGGRCYLCGVEAEAIDHVKPLAAGGSHWPANLRPICWRCNSRKQDLWPMGVVLAQLAEG